MKSSERRGKKQRSDLEGFAKRLGCVKQGLELQEVLKDDGGKRS